MKKTKGNFYLEKNGVGKHLIAEFYGCKDISSTFQVRKILREAVERMGATLLKVSIYKFHPQGLTAIALLAESHLSIHSWPEFNYVAIDIFTCGKQNPKLALEVLKEKYQPKQIKVIKLVRGK